MWLFRSWRIFGPINLSKHSPWDLVWMITFSERKFAEEERVLYKWISETLWKNLDKHEGKEPWSWSHITPARLYLKRSPIGSIFRSQKASVVGARNSRPATIRNGLFWHRKILSKREDSALPSNGVTPTLFGGFLRKTYWSNYIFRPKIK